MKEPLAWYIAGPLIGLVIPVLLILRGKQFGISSTYRFWGSYVLPRLSYFDYSRKSDLWQVQLTIGIFLSGILTGFFGQEVKLDEVTSKLHYEKVALTIYESKNWIQFLFGGILIGFGSRYANGCTAGHCIMGVSQLSLSSMIVTICFFVGGLLGSQFIIPLIF
ncbi:MAG: YeeE/YedE family protein [Bacteroidetes bacterium]|nr:MAG: YeeE/YedE family protein [Bacteroidota bacterium]